MSEPSTPPAATSLYNRKNPFLAKLTANQPLTQAGSGKDTRHFVFSLVGSGLNYLPGDTLGVFPRNAPKLVDELIAVLGLEAQAPVRNSAGQTTTFREALLNSHMLNRASKKIVISLVERIPQGEQRNRLCEIVNNDELLSQYIYDRDCVDILKEFDEAKFNTPEGFLAQLSPISPRLYSIASSLAAHPTEVHLCVAIVRYTTHGRPKSGLASGFFADTAELGTNTVPVYIQESRHFRLPADGARDIIMVGPGTGIAPFRAFLEQRVLDGASGRNWLVFGEQHRATDFFYADQFLNYQKLGKLHRLDLAFSRDQAEKIYVQHRMREHAAELWRWLQGGAYFYVCGDAKRMAKDVHQALIDIAREQGGLSPEAAAEYVNVTLMKTEKRYLRAVY